MKKFSLTALVLAVVFSFALKSSAQVTELDKGYISVSQSQTKEVQPNQAEISIGIETSDVSLQKATDDNKAIASKVYASLKALLGVDDYIKTSEYSVKPQYSYTKDNKKVFDKYVVENTVVVKTKKLDVVSTLVDTAIAQGANNINNLQFSVTNYDLACNDALSELTKKAYSQANSVATSINSKILGIKSINATCTQDQGPRPYYDYMAKSALNAVSAAPIEGGKVKIYVNVDASFYVK